MSARALIATLNVTGSGTPNSSQVPLPRVAKLLQCRTEDVLDEDQFPLGRDHDSVGRDRAVDRIGHLLSPGGCGVHELPDHAANGRNLGGDRSFFRAGKQD